MISNDSEKHNGRLLRVSLTDERINHEKISENTLRKYIGGTGLGIKYLYDEVSPNTRSFDSENRLIFSAGPLNGTVVRGSGSYSVVTKGPLTNGAASSQANGVWGAFLKFCGLDSVIVQGKSKEWVYLYISEDTVELRDAGHLVTKDTYKTEDIIKEDFGKGKNQYSVASIGPAGENFVRFAGIFSDKGHVAPHNGTGAVMGSKKLKAIVVERGKNRPEVTDKDSLFDVAGQLWEEAKEASINKYGTLSSFILGYEDNWLPVKNYTTNQWDVSEDELKKFEAENIRKNFEISSKICYNCPMQHSDLMKFKEGPYEGLETEEPDYEQLASWSSQIGNTDIEGTIMLSNLVDRLGIDTNEASWIVGFVIECYEKGILTKEEVDGLKMSWGNVGATKSLLKMIASREGIGDILAEGVKRASEKIGDEAKRLAIYTKKGNTPRSHDHRIRTWEQFDTCISNTGTKEYSNTLLPRIGPHKWKELIEKFVIHKGKMQFEDSMVTCRFHTQTNLELLSEAVKAVTGWDFTYKEAIKVGHRILNLLRSFNIKHGLIGSNLDYPSPKYGSTPQDGPYKGKSLKNNWKKMLKAYYRGMGWDENGKPLPETLNKLGLDYVEKDLR